MSKDSVNFKNVGVDLETVRMKHKPISDEAIFLGICRDIAIHIGRGNNEKVKSLVDEMETEFVKQFLQIVLFW